ncbi:MAG: DHA2 family efflux MFS transporter permease subunit [Caulobacteraceae bacterium]|nr:DHA2 family efflux MFS transporter permease subunit [Caulobacteraceae bacterium]
MTALQAEAAAGQADARARAVAAAFERRRGFITFGLIAATFMGTLDQTVVNVALAHIQGSLSASQEEITWVLTCYLVATAVTTPISSWLAARFGLKPMALTCISLFTVASVLCGLATNLPEMIAFRIVQGVTIAPVPPIAQAVLLRINPPSRYGRAIALFSTAAMAGPVAGPVLGGYLTEALSWRWCFFINLWPGAFALLALWFSMPAEEPQPRRFDFLGFGSLAVAIGAFQLMLDRGPVQDWFGSTEIWADAIIAGIGVWIYATHTLSARHPLFDPALIRDRNFVVGTGVLFAMTTLTYSSIALMPLMTQTLMGYPPLTTGFLNLPRALLALAALQVIGRVDRFIDRRLLAGAGLTLLAVGYWSMGKFDLSMGPETIIVATLMQGLGQGCVTVPVTTMSFATIGPRQQADASTVSSLLRSLSGGVGVSVTEAFLSSHTQMMHASMTAQLIPGDPVLRAGLPPALWPETLAGAFALNAEITRQASMVAFVESYRIMVLLTLICVPLLLLLRYRRPVPGAAPQAAVVGD